MSIDGEFPVGLSRVADALLSQGNAILQEQERIRNEEIARDAEAARRKEEAEQAAADRALADVPTVQAMKSAEGYRKNLEGIADSRDAVAAAVANGFLLLASVIGSQSL